MLLITFLMVIGAFNTLATIVSYLCSVWQYTDSEASLFGAMFIVGGIFALLNGERARLGLPPLGLVLC